MKDSKGNKFSVGDTLCADGYPGCIVRVIAIDNEVARIEWESILGTRPRFSINQSSMNISKWIVVK